MKEGFIICKNGGKFVRTECKSNIIEWQCPVVNEYPKSYLSRLERVGNLWARPLTTTAFCYNNVRYCIVKNWHVSWVENVDQENTS